jgi:long-chain acyl-CoA synthetase
MATTADELRAHAAGLLAAHKVPKRIEIRRDDFPRNASGKILKRQLRAELTEDVASA